MHKSRCTNQYSIVHADITSGSSRCSNGRCSGVGGIASEVVDHLLVELLGSGLAASASSSGTTSTTTTLGGSGTTPTTDDSGLNNRLGLGSSGLSGVDNLVGGTDDYIS